MVLNTSEYLENVYGLIPFWQIRYKPSEDNTLYTMYVFVVVQEGSVVNSVKVMEGSIKIRAEGTLFDKKDFIPFLMSRAAAVVELYCL